MESLHRSVKPLFTDRLTVMWPAGPKLTCVTLGFVEIIEVVYLNVFRVRHILFDVTVFVHRHLLIYIIISLNLLI